MYEQGRRRTRTIGRGKRILIIDPDRDSRVALARCLQGNEFDVDSVASGMEALEHVEEDNVPHLIIIDIAHPDEDGFQLARTLKEGGDIPIIVVSRSANVATVVQAISEFADDFIKKPYVESELLARVHRVLLRVGLPYSGPHASRQRVGDDLYVDFITGHAYVNDTRVALTPTEGRILQILHTNRGQIVPYEQMMSQIWHDYGSGQLSRLWVHVRRLRAKIEADPEKPSRLLTVRGNGYYLSR